MALGRDACRSLARRFAISKWSCIAMDALPCAAQGCQVVHQHVSDMPDLLPRELVVFTKLRGSRRTVQVEYRFMTPPDHMDMSWSVVVRINHHTQPLESKNCRHFNRHYHI